jgi:L-ascorbate metabolism protein UlaG (beta-lactamase superfamily)
MDPYLSRFDTGLAAGHFDPQTRIRVDEAAIDEALGAPGTPDGEVDAILVSHTHWDHFADVPHIARTRDATVFTTLTGYHLAQSMGATPSHLAVVRGAEEMHLGDLVLRAVSSRHSRSASGTLLFPGIRTETPKRPRTIADLPEGDTLAFLLRAPSGRSVLLMGASDFDDQSLRGLEPDAVALPVPSNEVTADYVGRLLSVIGQPRTVVLVHWDDFESPPVHPPRSSAETRRQIRQSTREIHRFSPRSRVLVPDYSTVLRLL